LKFPAYICPQHLQEKKMWGAAFSVAELLEGVQQVGSFTRATTQAAQHFYSACCLPRERCVCIPASVAFSPLA
jgi:hypothetical protein